MSHNKAWGESAASLEVMLAADTKIEFTCYLLHRSAMVWATATMILGTASAQLVGRGHHVSMSSCAPAPSPSETKATSQ
jgi:hypothetical protein